MRILILGASGFIGEQIASTLIKAGHTVIAGVRARSICPLANIETMVCDFNCDTDHTIWLARLQNIDAVINCVGVLQQRQRQSIKAIHELTPQALYQACEQLGIKRIIHISALGVDLPVNTAYAATKKAAEDYLMQTKTPWIILRPSLVYGSGSYGGTSLFRALAALPGFIPVIDQGQQSFQPIHIEDLAQAVLRLLENDQAKQQILMAVGTEQITFTKLLLLLRQWLKLGKACIIRIPLWLTRCAARCSDWLGIGPLSTTSLQMLIAGNTTSEAELKKFIQAINFVPRTLTEFMQTTPSYVQDRWHARLYFLRPLLRISIGLLWLGSGIVSLIPPFTQSYELLARVGVSHALAPLLLFGAAFLDIILGVATLLNWRLQLTSLLQISTIIIYTIICSWKLPELWLQPFAPLLKNSPILIATLIMLAIAEDR